METFAVMSIVEDDESRTVGTIIEIQIAATASKVSFSLARSALPPMISRNRLSFVSEHTLLTMYSHISFSS